MLNLGTVKQDATVHIPLPTRAADGGAEAFSATLEEADFDLHKDGATTPLTLDASTITINESVGTTAGKNMVSVDLSNDADLSGSTAAGSQIQVWITPDETVDTQTVVECIAVFTIESDSEKAVRLLREKLYPTTSEISTTTGNDTTTINLTDIVDAQTPDAALVGMILAVHDATDDRVEHVVVTSASSLVATVRRLGDGTAMSFTVAAGDHVWIVGYTDLNLLDAIKAKTDSLTFSKAGEVDANVQSINDTTTTGSGTSGDPWGP